MDVEQIERYLASRHTSTFGRAFFINSENGRRYCAEWLAKVYREIEAQGEGDDKRDATTTSEAQKHQRRQPQCSECFPLGCNQLCNDGP